MAPSICAVWHISFKKSASTVGMWMIEIHSSKKKDDVATLDLAEVASPSVPTSPSAVDLALRVLRPRGFITVLYGWLGRALHSACVWLPRPLFQWPLGPVGPHHGPLSQRLHRITSPFSRDPQTLIVLIKT